MIMQLKCDICDAYIVLHASLAGIKNMKIEREEAGRIQNASSSLCMNEGEVEMLREFLQKAGGSFERMFQEESKKM